MLEWLESVSIRVLRLNPCVLLHELRLRMRSRSVFWVLLLFVLLCSLAAIAPYAVFFVQHAAHPRQPAELQELGRQGMFALLYVLLTLMVLALPAAAAGAIAGERQRGSLETLRPTLLSASDIALGKFLATMAYAVTLLAVSLPIAAWCVLMGAVAPREVATGYAILVAFAAVLAGVGTWLSALCAGVVTAVAATYVTVVVIFGAVLLVPELSDRLHGVAGCIFEGMAPAVGCALPAGVTAWLIAALVRWVAARAGRMRSDSAQALLGVIVFGTLVLGMGFWAEGQDLWGLYDLRSMVCLNPFVGLWETIDRDAPAWPAIWSMLSMAAVGCLLAARCLRLREFQPYYVTDLFRSAWRRVASLRRALPARASRQTPARSWRPSRRSPARRNAHAGGAS